MKKFLALFLIFSLAGIIIASCSNLETESFDKTDIDSVEIIVDSYTSYSSSRSIHSGGIYCKKDVTFSGTVTASRKVKKIFAQIKKSGDESFTDLKKADFSNGQWSCSLFFEEEASFLLRFVAFDEDNKSNAASAKIIPVFVSNTNDDYHSLWYIDRGTESEQLYLKSLSELEKIDLSLPENKDEAQNSSFRLCINQISSESFLCKAIQIRDENDNNICTVEDSSKSGNPPEFLINEKLLVSSDNSLSAGKHFLKVIYNYDSYEIDAGFFIWWPESDYPKIYTDFSTDEDDSINLHTNQEFEITAFDDDCLYSAYCALLSEEEAASVKYSSEELQDNPEFLKSLFSTDDYSDRYFTFFSKDNEREKTFNLKSLSSSQTMQLIALVSDNCVPHNSTIKTLTVNVIDDSVSALNIESPKNNEVPSVTFTEKNSRAIVPVKGYAVDTSGCKSLYFVWVSGLQTDEEKFEKAKKWLEELSDDLVSNNLEKDGMKLWNVNLSAPNKKNGFAYQSFSFNIDLFNDFGNEKLNDKYFVTKLSCTDGKCTYSDYRILADPTNLIISSIKFDCEDSLSVTLTANKDLKLSGKPAFEVLVQKEENTSLLQLPLVKSYGRALIFSLPIKDDEEIPNGKISYIPASCIKSADTITDQSGNLLIVNNETSPIDAEITIDTLPPEAVSMTPDGETEENSNIFKQGNKITIQFNEPVRKAAGNLILRQTAGWAIPPVLTEEQFKKLSEELDESDLEILSRLENGSSMEDSEKILKSNSKYPNDTYHGTGQYVGPYKKSAQGLKLSDDGEHFIPDTSVKYVLDFDIDIWETEKVHYFAKTFEKGFATQQKYEKRGYESLTNKLKIVAPETAKLKGSKRTVNQIRKIFEKAHFHERILDVTSDEVELSEDGMTVTVNFPAGLYDENDDLPAGREWEFAVENGAFTDLAGNEFKNPDASETVMANVNDKKSFWSDKVAKPVVRVDRYSYGLGILQADENGKRSNQIIADKSNYLPQSHDSIKPTGYVRVRIDCETKGSSIEYSVIKKTSSPRKDNPPCENDPYFLDKKERSFYSYYTDTEALSKNEYENLKSYEKSSEPDNENNASPVFSAGNGLYNQSFKHYVVAHAVKSGFTSSEQGIEGIFQTVVQFVNPETASRSSATSSTIGQKDVSIHGAPADGSYISPFPLQYAQNGSPYLRRCYRENSNVGTGKSLDYYWVSYEILSEASFSYYNWKSSYYEWADNKGIMKPGEFTRFISE